MRNPALIPMLGLLAMACNGKDPSTDDDPTDTGDDVVYEPGCITVDGGGGYANLVDAVFVAGDGATITLCTVVEEALVIDKTITIEGNGALLIPPVNTAAVTVLDGGQLTISDVEVETTRSAFVVEPGGELTLTDATLATVPNYGVDVQAGAIAVLDRVTMTQPGWGGAKVSGGTLTMTDSIIEEPGAYGVYVELDGTVTLEGNTINAPRFGGTGNLFDVDGVGVWLESGATATMSGNTITNAGVAAVSADDAAQLTMTGDQLLGGYAAMTIRGSNVDISGVEAQGYFQYGFLCVACGEATLESVSFETDPLASQVQTPEGNGSSGLYAIETEVTVTGTPEAPSRFVGNNGAGILVSPQNGGSVSALTASNTIVDNNAVFGVAIYSGEATLTDVDISNTRNDDANCLTDTGYSCNMALALWSSTADMFGGSVTDSNDWGVTAVNGLFRADGTTIARNERYGVFGQASGLDLANITFSEGGQYSVAAFQGTSGVIANSTFADGRYTTISEFDNGNGSIIRQESYYNGQDVYVSDSDLVVQDSTFTNGDRGIGANGFSSGADITVTNVTFDGYNQYAINGSTGSTWNLDRVTFTDTGRYAVYCFSAEMSLDKVSISNTTKYDYRFDYYIDDELQFSSEFQQADRALYASRCDMKLDTVAVDGADGSGLYFDNTSLEIDGLTVRDLFRDGGGTSGMDLNWRQVITDGATDPISLPQVYANNVEIQGVKAGSGMRLFSWIDATEGTLASGVVSFTDLRIGGGGEDGIAGTGLDASNISDLTINGLDVGGTGGVGVSLAQTNANITGRSTARSGYVETAGADGIRIDATMKDASSTSVTLKDLTILDPRGSGISVNGGNHSFTGVVVERAGDWGATCSDATFDVCDATLDGASGDHDGCGACDAGI